VNRQLGMLALLEWTEEALLGAIDYQEEDKGRREKEWVPPDHLQSYSSDSK
jgi:hypothetical protein